MSEAPTKPIERQALARLPLHLLSRAAEYGLDRDQLTRDAGLSEAELKDPDARVSIRKLWTLWRIAIEKTGDDDLPLRVISTIPLRAYGLVGYLMVNSRTIGDAFDRLEKYSRIVTGAVGFHWEQDASAGRMTLVEALSDLPPRAGPDARLAFVVCAARELAARPIAPREVRLPYPRPVETTLLERTFGSRLSFDQRSVGVVFDRADVDSGVVEADETLAGYLDELAGRVLCSIPAAASFPDRVRLQMWNALRDGGADLTRVASGLALSSRTLQRRLREEKTSFVELLDGVRRDLAIELLRGRELSVNEVACLLGYSEPSTFYRAFRRWTGTSPRSFRSPAGGR